MKPRAAQKARTRQELLSAARRCFARQGFAATGIGDVSREAGVAHGTFYVHFDSKEAVADALLQEFNESLASRLTAVLARSSDASIDKTIRRFAAAFLDQLETERSFVAWNAERIAGSLDPTSLREGVNPPVLAVVTHVLEATAAERGASVPHAQLAAQGLLALWIRIGLQRALGDRVPRSAAEDLLTTMTTGAVESLLGLAHAPTRGRARKRGVEKKP